jgi:hypothetical protein
MPHRRDYLESRNWRQAEVLSRIAAGRTLSAVCADTDMPHISSVCRWAQQSPAFADALAAAQRRGVARRRYDFDEVKARAFLARLRAGETLVALTRAPAMPGREMLRCWRLTQGEFGGEVLRVIRLQRVERQRRHLRRPPPDWSAALADRVLLLVGRGHPCDSLRRLDPALPAYEVIRRWRRERPVFDAEFRMNLRMGRLARGGARGKAHRTAVLEPLLDGIVCGGSLHSLGGRDGLPSRDTLYRWVGRDRDFAREVTQACEHREDWYNDQILEIADEAQRIGVAEARRRMAPLSRQLGQLKRRPGRRWTRSG